MKQPSIETLAALARALEVEVSDLLKRQETEVVVEPVKRTHYVDAALADLNAEDQALIAEVLTKLVHRLKSQQS